MSEETSWWVDANVLLRFLTGEPPELAKSAAGLLEAAEEDGTPLRVHSVVVAETVWVLRSFYGYSVRFPVALSPFWSSPPCAWRVPKP